MPEVAITEQKRDSHNRRKSELSIGDAGMLTLMAMAA